MHGYKPGDVVTWMTENARPVQGRVIRVYSTCLELWPSYWWDYPDQENPPLQGVPLSAVVGLAL